MSSESTFTLEEIKQACEPLWNNVECLTCSRLLAYIKVFLSGVEDVSDDADALHFAICQAVTLMAQGDNHVALDALRQCLVDFADKKKPLSRTEIIRKQQQSGTDKVTTVMVSTDSSKEKSNG